MTKYWYQQRKQVFSLIYDCGNRSCAPLIYIRVCESQEREQVCGVRKLMFPHIFEHLFTSSYLKQTNGEMFSHLSIIFIHLCYVFRIFPHFVGNLNRSNNLCPSAKSKEPRIKLPCQPHFDAHCKVVFILRYHNHSSSESIRPS